MATAAATSSEIGTPATWPWPMATKAGGRLPMLLASVWTAVYQIAAPLKNIIVVSVTMNGGMLSRAVQTPLSQPMAPPTRMKATTPPGTAAQLWPR